MRAGFAVLLLLVVSIVSSVPAHAQGFDYPPEACPYPDSPHYRANVGQTMQDGQLILVDTDTQATLMVLDSTVLTYYKHNIFWAQNCRYLIALNVYAPYTPYPRRFSSIYDTLTGQRIFHSGPGREIIFQYIPSPTRNEFLIKSFRGLYLMTESFSEPVLLSDNVNPGSSYTYYYHWDMARRQLLVNLRKDAGKLMIFDLSTGGQIAAIAEPEGCSRTRVQFARTPDDRYLLVYPFGGDPACVTVYNRDTNTVVAQVNSEQRAAAEPGQIALSPDGRYLVIGRQVLRVWDLSNLGEKIEDRLPTYRHDGPERIIHNIHFVSSEVVEVTTLDGITQWNILTGEQVSP